MDRVSVVSSVIASVGYSEEALLLDIEFRRGDIYRYDQVPSSVYEKLMEADSKGTYFNAYIKHAFAYKKIQDAA